MKQYIQSGMFYINSLLGACSEVSITSFVRFGVKIGINTILSLTRSTTLRGIAGVINLRMIDIGSIPVAGTGLGVTSEMDGQRRMKQLSVVIFGKVRRTFAQTM